MPWADPELNTQYLQPYAVGPRIQTTPSFEGNPIPATLAAAGNWDSGVLAGDGYISIAASVTSTQGGALTIQRYLDPAGTVPQGAALSATLTGGTAGVLNTSDGLIFSSFRVKVTNTGGSTATITAFYVLMQA